MVCFTNTNTENNETNEQKKKDRSNYPLFKEWNYNYFVYVFRYLKYRYRRIKVFLYARYLYTDITKNKEKQIPDRIFIFSFFSLKPGIILSVGCNTQWNFEKIKLHIRNNSQKGTKPFQLHEINIRKLK